jgi:hypothetical protein
VAKSWNTRTGSAEERTVTAQADALRACRGGSERNHGRGDGEVRPVVLAQPKDLEAKLVGKLDLLEQLTQPPRRPARIRAKWQIREGGKAQFHTARLSLRAAFTPARWVSIPWPAGARSYGDDASTGERVPRAVSSERAP